MADVTRVAGASMDASTGMFAPQITGNLYAGEALAACAPCYIKAADGKVYQSNGTAANEAAKFDGMTPEAYAVGDAIALFGVGARFRYGSAMTPGQPLFVSATAGVLSDAATTGGTVPIARAISATDIRIILNAA